MNIDSTNPGHMKMTADDARKLVAQAMEQSKDREQKALKEWLDDAEKAICEASIKMLDKVEIPCKGGIRALAIAALKEAGYQAESLHWSNAIQISWSK